MDQELGRGTLDDKNSLSLERAEILASDLQIQKMFGLTSDEIRTMVLRIKTVTKRFSVSPGFCSPGYGGADREPIIQLSSIIPVGQNELEHEDKHGLHFRLCEKLFELDDATEYLKLFEQNVLGDEEFVEMIARSGTPRQREYLKLATDLMREPGKSGEFAWLFGALTYQHAYFVDPATAEAAASFRDRGNFLKVLHLANRTVGTYLIPGDNPMRGYGNTAMQKMFMEAPFDRRAILEKKSQYQREKHFKE